MDPLRYPAHIPRRFQNRLNDISSPLYIKTASRFRRLPARFNRLRVELFREVDLLDLERWNHGPGVFPINDLVMFALLYHEQATVINIAEWIIDYFLWYDREHPTPKFPSPGAHEKPWGVRVRQEFLLDILESLFSLEMPVFKQRMDLSWTACLYRINLPAAETIVNRVKMRGKAIQPFRFLDLPSELRRIVYKMVLGFSDSGLVITHEPFGVDRKVVAMVYVATDDFKAPVHWSRWVKPYYWTYLHGQSLGKYLEIICASKQVYAEAMPLFYSTNKFVCWDLDALGLFFKFTSASRLEHVRKLMINYIKKRSTVSAWPLFDIIERRRLNPTNGRMEVVQPFEVNVIKTCQMLKHMPGLQILEIIFSESEHGILPGRTDAELQKILKITGLKELMNMRGLKQVTFHGDCDHVRAVLVPEMRKPKRASKETKLKAELERRRFR